MLIRAERRSLFWASFQPAAAIVLKEPSAATAEAADRQLFEGRLGDGLDVEPIPD
jgi:hypothetical protein